jgi:hypothetical protein
VGRTDEVELRGVGERLPARVSADKIDPALPGIGPDASVGRADRLEPALAGLGDLSNSLEIRLEMGDPRDQTRYVPQSVR